MTIDDKNRDEKLKYDIIREAAKISALSSNKIGKYEYLTGEEILPSSRKQIIDQAKFTYSPLGKAFEKQIKILEDQGEKQIKALKDLKRDKPTKSAEGIFPVGYENVEIENEINKITGYEQNVNTNNMIYYWNNEPFDFKTFKTIRPLEENIYSGKITINEANEEQADLIEYILNLNNKATPKNKDDRKIK